MRKSQRASQWAGLPDVDYFGVTEPWTARLLTAFLGAIGGESVLEVGASVGHTSAYLILALEKMGGGTFVGWEPDEQRRTLANERLTKLPVPSVSWRIEPTVSPAGFHAISDDTFDFVWIDASHRAEDVRRDFTAAQRVVRPGGLVVGHDVFGCYPLRGIFPVELHLAPLYSSWGIGLWQKPL